MSTFIINPHVGGPVEAEFLGYGGVATRSGAVHTLAGYGFGSAGPRRKIIVPVHAQRFGDINMTFVSATIGGEAAELIASASGTITGVRRAIYLIGAAPAGGSGDIAVTFGQNTSEINAWIAGYRVVNLKSVMPAAPANKGETSFSTNDNTRSGSADVPAKGLYLASATVAHNGGTNSFTGVSNDYFVTNFGGEVHITSGFAVVSAAEAGKTTTFTKIGGAASMHGGIVAVGLR